MMKIKVGQVYRWSDRLYEGYVLRVKIIEKDKRLVPVIIEMVNGKVSYDDQIGDIYAPGTNFAYERAWVLDMEYVNREKAKKALGL